MATIENVVIKITTTASTRQVRQAKNDLLKLAAAGKLGNTTVSDLESGFTKLDRKMKFVRNTLKDFTKALVTLNKVAVKLFTIGFAIGSAALAANNALFAAGRWLVSAYRVAMQGLAVVVAAVGAGLATAAAAFNEYTAAANAYAFKSSPALRSRLGESSAALRNLQSDATLATFGVKALAGAFAAISKNAQVTGMSKTLLKGLADFAAAGGDPAKNLAAAGEFIGLLQKAGKLDSKAIAAAQGIGPTFVEALKKARAQGVSTLSEFTKMLSSGELAKLGGVEGQAGIVGGTLMGQFRAFTVEMLKMATDFGQVLLGPVKTALDAIGKIIQKTIMRIGPEMIKFGEGPTIKALVRLFEIIDNFAINLFRKHLPGANGMMSRFADFWHKTVFFIKDVTKRLQSLLPGGRAVIEAFGKPFMEVFKTVGTWIRYIGESITKNQDKYNALGQSILDFVKKIQEIGKIFIDNFTEALPFLTHIIDWVTRLIDKFMTLADVIGAIGDLLGGLINMLGGMGDGLGGFGKVVGMGIIASMLRYKLGQLNYLPQSGMMYTVGGQVARGSQAAGQAAGRTVGQTFSPVVGGSQAQALGLFPRMSNAYRGARRGGAGFTGRIRAANTARQRYFQQNPRAPFLSGMGPATIMGIGSMFAAPEAQTPLMGGAAIASLAPFLGSAGPYAALTGIGVAGYGIMQNARTEGGGMLGGAMTGGAIGAAIGSFIPGIGTLLGGVIGAALGSVYGYFKGKSNKEKNKARTAATEYMNDQMQGVTESLVMGQTGDVRAKLTDMLDNAKRIREINDQYFQGMDDKGRDRHGRGMRRDTANQLYEAGTISAAERDALANAPGTYAAELTKQTDLYVKVLTPALRRFDQAAATAATTLGMTSDELVVLAREKGVDLYDQTVSLRDKFVALGLAMEFTSEQIVGAMRDIQINGVERLMNRIDQAMSPKRIDEMAEGLYQDFISGAEIGMDEVGQFITDFLNQLNIMNPDSPLTNVKTLLEMLGPNGALFRAGSQLEGMQDVFAPLTSMLMGLANQTKEDAASGLADIIIKQGLFGGVAFNRDELMGKLSGMSIAGLQGLQYRLQNGELSPIDLAALTGFSGAESSYQSAGGRQNIQSRLKAAGLEGVSFEKLDTTMMTMDQMVALYGEEGAAIVRGFGDVMRATFTNTPNWMNEPPSWYTAESFKALIEAVNGDSKFPDTSTPRGSGDTTSSRLGRTMRRHSFFDSMFSGSRNITSAYRTTNLGSINSDHIMGRAYDLTGDNLGAYATMVNRSGGFAEFHGRGGSRHLHVVPGETPIGDSTAPYMGSTPSMSSSSSTTNNYNITVQGTPGMDVGELADAVMTRIQRIERSSRERS